jgi:GNAT superfamily N-acetyltransferase
MEASDISIRTAHVGDAEDLARLCAQLGYPATSAQLASRLDLIARRSGHEVIVALRGNMVVGWLHVLRDIHLESGEFAEIAGLVVDADHRNGGVGRALIQAAETWARERGVAALRVRTNVVRADAHRFYQREGYKLQKEQKVFSKML